MQVNRIVAENFRNIAFQEICFEKGINVIYGKNASGKTNLLEAIYIFASGKSLRGSAEKNFIRRGEKLARISVEYETNGSPGYMRNLSVAFFGGNKKVMKCGGAEVAKMSELLGRFRACVFTPDDLALIKGSPEERRRFADISVSQMRPRFVRCLNDYFRVLSQKNVFLKSAQNSQNINYDYLEILNEQLAKAAGVIVKQRYGFCKNIYKYAKEIYRDISGEKELLGMKYVSQTKQNYEDEEYTQSAYMELFKKNAERELKYGVSLVGPQKDDILFYLGKDSDIELQSQSFKESEIYPKLFESGITAKSFGSRGQQRSAVLALKLAQGELFREICGEYPVFLLDDVFSELDEARRKYILSHAAEKQIIITCCDCDILGNISDYNVIRARNGQYESE